MTTIFLVFIMFTAGKFKLKSNQLDNESEIIRQIATGNQHAFTLMFDFYQRFVFDYGRKLTKSEDQAGEIVQDIFLKIWLNREHLASVDNFGAYLNTMVRNHSLNVIRKIANEFRYARVLQSELKEFSEATNEQLDYNETKRLLNEAIESLPSQQRMAYRLCHQEGLKYEQAAAEMNISARTVQAHMGQALKRIREHFKNNALAWPILFVALFK